MSDGVFRNKKGFTVVQNSVTRNKELSLKAKGLYMLIQSYITMPEKSWLKSDFQEMVIEGYCAFESAWKELKRAGYIKQHIYSTGKAFRTEYELLDEPQPGDSIFYYNKDGAVTKSLQ